MIQPFERQGSRVVLETPIFDLRADDVTHPVTGRRHTFYVLQTRPYVNVIAETAEGKVVLIRQWRHGTRDVGVEIPAGIAEAGESPEAAAARELREETGYVADRLTVLGQVQPNPAHQDNLSYTVLAEGCRKLAEVEFDDGEAIEVELVDADDIRRLALAGEIRSAMVVCALFWWLNHRGGLDWTALAAP